MTNNKNTRIPLMPFVILALFFILIKFGFIGINIVSANHFNLITINTVFAGFLFTSLALVVSLANDKSIVRLERGDIMNSIYKNISLGIVYSVISIGISFFNMLINPPLLNKYGETYLFVNEMLLYFMPGLELYFLFLTMFAFIMAVRDIKFVIVVVRNKIRSEFPSTEEVKKTLDRIK